MDDFRFDAWTRRRFGLAAGGIAAAVLGIAPGTDTEARKKRRKKKTRCKKLGDVCAGGKRKCCDNRACVLIDNSLRCCKDEGPCTDNFQCCSGLCFQGSCFLN
ncbi:MAG: hypothetical protein ACRDJC_09875 [Thermomicrobiales bacterium]